MAVVHKLAAAYKLLAVHNLADHNHPVETKVGLLAYIKQYEQEAQMSLGWGRPHWCH